MATAFPGARRTTALQTRARRTALAAGICLAGWTALAGQADAARCSRSPDAAERLSCSAVEAKDGWQRLVQHVRGSFVTPTSVTVRGSAAEVVNANGLLREGGGVATLRTSAEHSTMLVVDLGRLAQGNVEVGVRSASGAPIRVAYAQFASHLDIDGDGMGASFGTDDDPEGRVDVYAVPRGRAVLRSPGKREARYVGITLDGPGAVSVDFVRNRQTIYPVKYDGHFLSSDELLNRAWYASAYTGDLASMRQAGSNWMLTVTFDRVLFMGDLHMQGVAGYYQSSDYWMLMRNTLHQFGCIQNPDGSFPLASSPLVRCIPGNPGPPDGWRFPEEGPDPRDALGSVGNGFAYLKDMTIDSFTAYWVAGLNDYYMHTGDARFVAPLLPVARRAVAFLDSRTVNGLYAEPHDSVRYRLNWHPMDTSRGVDANSNAVYYAALNGLASLERGVARDAAAADQLVARGADVRSRLIAHLWDDGAGAMVLNDEDPRRDRTGDAQAGPLTFELLDDARGASAINWLGTALRTPWGTRSSEYDDNPYMQSYLHGYIMSLEALGRVRYGDATGATDLVRRWWGHMLANGPGTGWFVANNDGSVDRGYFANTAWTTALPALSEGLVGVRTTGAGFKQWTVAPQPADLSWAQGRVPTPHGGIESRWKRTSQGFVLTVEAPKSTVGEVVLPLLDGANKLAIDGRKVWGPGIRHGAEIERRGDTVVVSGVRGDHTFAVSR